MNLDLEWMKPLELSHSPHAIYEVNLERVASLPGVYVFGRRHGDVFEALYVGKANNLRSRVKTQFNNLRLMQHLKNARRGKRLLLTAMLRTKRGQRVAHCLPLAERALIRLFLASGDDLVNIQGTQLRQHEIWSSKRPGWVVPGVMYLEK